MGETILAVVIAFWFVVGMAVYRLAYRRNRT